MNTQERINLLEEQFGKYENWTELEMNRIANNENLIKLFNPEITNELLKRENKEISDIIFTLNIGMRMSDSNDLFKRYLIDIIENKPNAQERAKTLAEEKLLSPDLFMRLNAYLLVLSGQIEDEELLNRVINLEDVVKVDTDELQQIMLKIEPESGMIIIQAAIEMLYRIQEFYFERTERNIVVESEEFKELCKNITEAVKMLLKEAFKADNKEIPDNNDKKTE